MEEIIRQEKAMTFVVLLQKIKEGYFNGFFMQGYGLKVNIEDNTMDFYYDNDNKTFYPCILDYMTDMDVITRTVYPFIISKQKSVKMEPGVKDEHIDYTLVIKDIVDSVIDLEMELDACQGCTENLDEQLNEIKAYNEILRNLEINLESDDIRKPALERYYAKRKEEEEVEKRKEEYRKHRFDPIPLDGKNIHLMANNPLLMDIVEKLNILLKDRGNL